MVADDAVIAIYVSFRAVGDLHTVTPVVADDGCRSRSNAIAAVQDQMSRLDHDSDSPIVSHGHAGVRAFQVESTATNTDSGAGTVLDGPAIEMGKRVHAGEADGGAVLDGNVG